MELQQARGLAAQAWCEEKTKHLVMEPDLAEAFAQILVRRPASEPSEFENQIASAINRHSMENGSNTPDFLLASFLNACLGIFNATVNARDKWYSIKPQPGWDGKRHREVETATLPGMETQEPQPE